MTDREFLFIFALIILLVIGSLLLFHWIGPHLICYKLAPRRLEIRLFRFLCIRWIDYSKIVDIREVKWYDSIGIRGVLGLVLGGSWGNQVFVKSFVLITPKRSLSVIITPNTPTVFVTQVKSLISSSKRATGNSGVI